MQPSSSHACRIATLFAVAVLAACGNGPSAPETPPAIARWAGVYTGQSRFGAANGTWGNGGTYPLEITATGALALKGTALEAPEYDDGTSRLRWTIAAGNATNGEVTFHTSLTSDFFFRDLPNATAGRGFTGYIQRPGEGRLDYRGVLR
jgi:hypothetical protein